MFEISKADPALFIKREMARLQEQRYNGLKLVSEIRISLRNGTPGMLIMSLILSEFNDHAGEYISQDGQQILNGLPPDHEVRLTVEKQHQELLEIIHTTISADQPPCMLAEKFADLLEENIRYELRVLFPLINKSNGLN
jgi:hypothetical protein